MRILHCIHSIDPASGGTHEFVRQTALFGTEFGLEVEVVSLDDPDAAFIEPFPAPVHALGPGLFRYGYSAQLLPWLRHNRERFDLIVANGLWQYPTRATWLATRGTSTPYVVVPHGMLDPWFNSAYPLKRLKKIPYWLVSEYWALKGSRAVLFSSEDERLKARESFRPYVVNEKIVRFGTPAAPGNPHEQMDSLIARHPELSGKRILLHLGRLHEKKGVDLVIRAFASNCGQHPDLHLLIAGGGDDKYVMDLKSLAQSLGAGLAERITWPGMLTGDLKWGALRRAEAFVLLSHQENFGFAVCEALSCGTPVLISNKVNICKEVDSQRAGLVDDDSEEGASRLIAGWLAMSEPERAQMRAGAQTCFQTSFEIKACLEQMVGVLKQCLEPPGNPAGN